MMINNNYNRSVYDMTEGQTARPEKQKMEMTKGKRAGEFGRVHLGVFYSLL
jgi:hypothetical protein